MISLSRDYPDPAKPAADFEGGDPEMQGPSDPRNTVGEGARAESHRSGWLSAMFRQGRPMFYPLNYGPVMGVGPEGVEPPSFGLSLIISRRKGGYKETPIQTRPSN